jgi:hypothetical protein
MATIKPLTGLILAVLAIVAVASVRVTHDPVDPAVSPSYLDAEPVASDEAAFLVFPSAAAPAATAAGIRLSRVRILRITP